MDGNLKIVTEILKPSLVCFGGEDGGMSFIKLRVFLENMVDRSIDGDENADEVIKVVERFNRVIEIANREM